MCGIVGYIGNKDKCVTALLQGLKKLEYRGYDSAGIAFFDFFGNLKVYKEIGMVSRLALSVPDSAVSSIGIAHTRWATHGGVTVANAHPHLSQSGRFAVVHNGTIENFEEIKETFGLHDLKSNTDTEVIAHLLEHYSKECSTVEEAIIETRKQLCGSYALAIVDCESPDVLYAVKLGSPLLIGIGDDFNIVVSAEIGALDFTSKFVHLNDGEYAIISESGYTIKTDVDTIINRKQFISEIDVQETTMCGYPHYMLKEINEQPIVISKIVNEYKNNIISPQIINELENADKIYIIGCGTSYHAGLVGKNLFQNLCNKPTEVCIASEAAYELPYLSERPFFILISQSGETADVIAVLKEIEKHGKRALVITNVPGSILDRTCQYSLPLFAGPEIAVASTKAYTAQIAVLAILASTIKKIEFDVLSELTKISSCMNEFLEHGTESCLSIAAQIYKSNNAFYLGRLLDSYICQEAALKLKEISYIQAEAFAAGELKHGTISLIEEGTPIIAIITQKGISASTRNNLQEVIARGAKVFIISITSTESAVSSKDNIRLPDIHHLLTPMLAILPTQLIAYYSALKRNPDGNPDRPRNLAKSVTVE